MVGPERWLRGKVIAIQALGCEFDSQNPYKSRRRTLTPRSLPDSTHVLLNNARMHVPPSLVIINTILEI